MNKADLISAVAGNLRFSKKDVGMVVEESINVIKEAVVGGDDVKVAGLGTFTSKNVKERTARNPKTGETVMVPAKTAVKFKFAKSFKEIFK